MFSVNLVHTELFALAHVGVYKVCNDCSCPTCAEYSLSQLETPSSSTDVIFHIMLCLVSANFLYQWDISGKLFLLISCDLEELCTPKATDHTNRNFLFPPNPIPVFSSLSVSNWQIFCLWRHKPDYQITHTVVSPLELLQFHLCSQARGWGSPRGAK